MTETQLMPGQAAEGADTARQVLDCYLSSILALAECLEVACPPVGSQYYDPFIRIRRRLAFNGSPSAIEEACESVATTLAAYAEQCRKFFELRATDLDAIMTTLGDIERAGIEHFIPLSPQIDDIRKRLTAGQDNVTVDALTGLANRRELERQLKLRLAGGKNFCVLFFDIDEFGRFNETLGREAGDQILMQFADGLRTQIRARDIGARWLADEFIVIMECGIENASARTTQMAQFFRGPYTVKTDDAEAEIEIRVSAAVTEALPDDTPRKIWLRLEEEFHAQNPDAQR